MPDTQCTFEDSGFCNWIPKPSGGNGEWASGAAKGNEEGPPFDHSLSNEAGHYAFLHASDHNVEAKAGFYKAAPLSTDTICMDFWYHMDGANTKQLTLQADVGSQKLGELN